MVKPARTQRPRRNDPWEVLVVAALFFFPGVALQFQREPVVTFQPSPHATIQSVATGISPHAAHIFGLLAIAVALFIVWFYFRLRAQIRRDQDAGIRYPL